MNRRTRHLVVVTIAVLTATIASFGVYRAMERIPGRGRQAAPQPVVVAARTMPIGTELTERDLKVVAWPGDSIVPGAIASAADVVNRGLLVGVLENEPLTTSKLASRETGAGLPPAIPPGMRAISIKVDDVIGVSGFVSPGSRVDLVVTIRREDDSMTRTVASNVQVLAAGTRRDQARTETDAKGTSVVTLMVSPADAERIALAQSEGQIMLVLRNPLDELPTVTSGIKTATLMGQAEAAAPPPPAPVAKPPAPRRAAAPPPPAEPEPPVVRVRTVEAIRAAKRTEEVIK
jgi:pilus assembly protein CpaB